MRIVLLSTNVALGGAEKQVVELAIHLAERGHEVHVVSLVAPSAYQNVLAPGGVVLHAPRVWRIPALLRRLRPDVLHCHMFHANVLGRLLRLVLPFPVVISTIHSVVEAKRRTGAYRLRDGMYRLTDRLADQTVGVSEAVVRRHVEAKAVRRMMVIPNGVDTEVFRPDAEVRASMRRQLGLGEEFVWLAVGRLMWKKNYPALLDAFASLDGGVLLIAGEGPEEADLRARAGAGVRFLGRRDDIPALMNAADAFVLSSVVEGLPLVLLEAAASGLPCVCTDAGGVRETGIGIVVPQGELASGMRQIQSMPAAERRALGEAARRRAIEHYSLDSVVTQWEALYRRLSAWT